MKKIISIIAACAFTCMPLLSFASSRFFYSGDGKISIQSAQTKASFSGTYRNPDGTYRQDAVAKINRVFGADGSLQQEPISIRLIEFLDYLQDKFGGKTLVLVSGYRSPEYNTKLRENGALAGKASLHQYGMATDFSMAGVSSKAIWEYVRDLKFGGAGYYHGKNVHIDVGPGRWWDEATSGVGTDLADDNKVIMLVTDRDIYKPGETINLGFARMTAWPIGVQPEFVLERIDGDNVQGVSLRAKRSNPVKSIRLLRPSGPRNDNELPDPSCHVFNDWHPMLKMSWQVPYDLAPGRYKVRAKFCEKQWEAMPAEITTNEFEVINE